MERLYQNTRRQMPEDHKVFISKKNCTVNNNNLTRTSYMFRPLQGHHQGGIYQYIQRTVSPYHDQLFDLLFPPSFTPTQIKYTTKHQPPHSRTINLCSRWPHYEQSRSHSCLLECQRPAPFGQYKKFLLLVYFLVLVEGLLVSVC